MRRHARALVAALAIALGVGPAALDACVLSCEATSGQSHETAVPACHHSDDATPSPGRSWKPPAAPCGHDHHAIAATASPRDGRAASAAAHPGALTANLPAALTALAASDIAPRARSHCVDPTSPPVTPLRV